MEEQENKYDIESVADNTGNNQKFFVGMIIVVLAIIFAIYIYYPKDKVDDNLEARVEDDYDKSKRKLNLPKLAQPKQKRKKESFKSVSQIENKKPKMPVMPVSYARNNKKENEAKKEAARLKKKWEKRRKAKTIIISDKTNNRGNSEKGRTNDDYNSLIESISAQGVATKPTRAGNRGLSNSLDSNKFIGVTAKLMTNKSTVIAQGKIISCVLETAIHSDYSGFTRCITDENIFSYDGVNLILPKGSRVIGQYQGGLEQGKARIFVVWSRVITPDGIDVSIDSAGIDELGRTGHEATIRTHFFKRFGASALLSIVGGFASSKSENDVRFEEVGKSFNKSAEIALNDSIKIKPTAHKNQGDKISIFVSRDLDFTYVLGE